MTQTKQQKAELAVMVAGLAEAYRHRLSEAGLAMYTAGLEDLPLEALRSAFTRALRTCKFFPAVSELREMAGEVTPEARARVAWEAACRAAAEHGAYRSVTFDDPIINAVLRYMYGGAAWETFCSLPNSEDRFARPQFEKAYIDFYAHGVPDELARPLVGISDRSKAFHGREQDETAEVRTALPAPPAGTVKPALGVKGSGQQAIGIENIGRVPK